MYHEALRDSHLSRNTRKLIFQEARSDCHLLKMENEPQGKANLVEFRRGLQTPFPYTKIHSCIMKRFAIHTLVEIQGK